MQATVRVIGGHDPQREVMSLKQWLTRDDGLRGRIVITRPPVAAGEMGAVADAVIVALGSGGAATVLAGSLSAWLRSRRSDVTIEVTSRDGQSVRVVAQRVSDPNALVREVLGQVGEDDATA